VSVLQDGNEARPPLACEDRYVGGGAATGVNGEVRAALTAYLSAVDLLFPGLVHGLHMIGSLPLGDYRPGVSDLDILCMVGRPLDTRDLDRLAEMHAVMAGSPSIDGVYVTRDALAGPPAAAEPAPYFRDGRLHPGGMPLTPVIWRSLRDHSIAVRGPHGRDVCAEVEDEELRRWTYGNLMGYWTDLLRRCHEGLASRPAGTGVPADTVAWMVLGVSRSHYTLVTGEITSKRGGGEHALRAFPERWRPAIEESLGIRRCWAPGATVSEAGFAEALRYVEMVLRNAEDLWRSG
jgi:hypothetical protein